MLIEKCFYAIKDRVDVDDNLFKIERALNRIYDTNFTITISQNDTGIFYGVNIFPSVDTMDSLVQDIVKNKKYSKDIEESWANIKDWYIEIDSILLYDMSLNANPAEITSVLLHEIGHVVFSNRVPISLHHIIRLKMTEMTHQIRLLLSDTKINKLLNIAIADACSAKNFNTSDVAKTDADQFVTYYKYGDAMDSFIDKYIVRFGTENVNRSMAELNKDIEVIVNWAVLNVRELEFRKTQLKTALKVEILKNPSVFTKKIIHDVYTTFFGEVTDRYRELLSEQYMSTPTDVYAELQAEQNFTNFVHKALKEATEESDLFDKYGKLKKVNQADIDVLFVESDDIQTTDDKIYLLDKTYNYLEIINMGLDYISSGDKGMSTRVSQSKNTLLSMKAQLEKIRSNILSTKIIEKEWGTFVRAPKGYEG